MSCLSCCGMLAECRCIMPEIEAQELEEEEEERTPRHDRIYSNNTLKWMGGTSNNRSLRQSVVSNASNSHRSASRSSRGFLDPLDHI